MSLNGYIKIHRKMMDWEWYTDPLTARLFFHLILSVRHKDGRRFGVEVKRGQMLTGIYELSEQTGLSVRQTRTRLDRLEQTGEITRKTTNKFSIITVVKYSDYQDNDSEPTSNRQATDKQPTSNRPLSKKERKKEGKNINTTPPKPKVLDGRSKDFVEAFSGFKIMRKKIKKPMTDRAVELTIKELEKLAPLDEAKQIQILEQSIRNSWQGVFPLNGGEKRKSVGVV
jgi:hypothetical protein